MIKILIGKSAAGKDYYFRKLLAAGYEEFISCTTRPIRENEKEGVDYLFMSDDEFDALVSSGEIFEFREYKTEVAGNVDIWKYGSMKQDIHPDKDYVVVVDIDGAASFIEVYGAQNCEIILFTAPDDVREKRAMQRGSFDKHEWDRRCADDAVKFSDEAIRAFENQHNCHIRVVDNSENGKSVTI